MSEFNLLKDAYSITNSNICRYDTLNGYISNFNTNGDVNGWDVYDGICMYGSWNSVLFGTTTENICFLGRANPINPVSAEKYYILKLTMKITLPEDYGKKVPPTKGKLQWQTASNPIWSDNYTKEFDLNLTDQWYTYIINLGEVKTWIGDINQLRIYPIIDGFEGINFMIRSVVIDSVNEFTCLNTQCSYYQEYSHPCPGMGVRASVKSGISMETYSTVRGESDVLILNIDNYGDECISLGNNSNLSGIEMSKILLDKISRVNVGQYAYTEVSYIEEEGKLIIYSGAMSEASDIKVSGTAAKALGFLNAFGDDVSEYTQGTSPASGFDYSSARRLKGFELNDLVDSNIEDVAYYHDPNQYSVEAGRRDFIDSMSSSFSASADKVDYYDLIEASQKIIIDASHPINDSGRLNKIWVNGNYIDKQGSDSLFIPKVYIIRPNKNGLAKIVYELEISLEDPDLRYTKDHVTFRVDCDVIVSKGDLIGFYNLQILAPFSAKTQTPNTVYFQIDCGADGPGSDNFSLGTPKSKGVIGLSFYARSDRLQSDIQLDIDIGERTNIEELSLYGAELSNFFEYNVACCLDVNWTVDCHGFTHWHKVDSRCAVTTTLVYVEHLNIPYGVECLSDCITTADGGQVGDSYITRSMGPTQSDGGFGSVANSDPGYYSGIETYGEHSYCYVNGDAEWLNGGCCLGESCNAKKVVQAEFKDPWVADVYNYEFDPISYYLIFPDNKWLDVHKTIMYFKESQNFKRYSLSYYLGESGEQGNAEEIHFNYVPSYTAVTLDGIKITPDQADGNSLTQAYTDTLFANPVPWALPEYQNDVCINWDIYQTIMNTEVNVLQHDFDPVSCRGFQIRSTWHKSTKLTELELYSQIPVEPSLLDNIKVQTSVYGEHWDELVFLNDLSNSEKINAYVPNSPRYFRVQLQSQDVFELKEIKAKISEKYIKSLGCSNNLLPEVAPKYTYSSPIKLEIENVYDIPLDLMIDIPRQLFKDEQVLSWIRFDSEETAINGEVGPGAIIHKASDYPLYLENGQVAINTPSYYLKNLIDGKNSYVYENDYKWGEYKKLYHGEDVDYTNEIDGKITSMTFIPISTKFWKLSIHEPKSIDIKNLSLFYTQDSALIPASPSIHSFSSYADGEHLPEAYWTQNFTAEGGYFNIKSDSGYKYERSKFFLQGDFEIEFRWILDNCNMYTDRYSAAPVLKIRSASDLGRYVGMQFDYGYTDDTYYHTSHERVYTYWTDFEHNFHVDYRNYINVRGYDRWVYFKMVRMGNNFDMYMKEVTQTYNEDLISYYKMSTIEYPGNFGDKVYVELGVNEDTYYTNNTISVNFSKLLITGTAFIGDFDTNYVAENPVAIDKVHIQAEPLEGSGKYETTFDDDEKVINPAVLIEDNFSDGIWYDKWVAYTGVGTSNTFIEKNSTLYPYIEPGDLIYIEKEFLPGAISFDAEVHFNFEFPTTLTYSIEFLSPDGEVSFRFRITGYGNNTALLFIETIVPTEQGVELEHNRNERPFYYKYGTFTKNVFEYVDGFKFTCKKCYNSYSYINLTNTSGDRTFYSGTNKSANWDRISKIRITYSNTSIYGIKDQLKNYGTTYIRFRALPNLSDYESIVFEFKDSTPIDTIKLVQYEGDIEYPIIRISDYDVDDYRIWAKNFIITDSVSVPHMSIWGSDAYRAPYYGNSYGWLPEYAFMYDYDTTFQNGPEHWCAYDFGAGNSKIIQRIYYKSRYEDIGYTPSGENVWKRCQIYGSNEYNVFWVSKGSYSEVAKFDLTNATFLKEFIINHSWDETAYNIVDFENNIPFRYIVLRWPERDFTVVDPYGGWSVQLKWVKFYEKFEGEADSPITLYNSNYTNYLAIDLEKPHNLDFIRNYGPKSDLLELFHEQTYLDYSNSDTSDINEVKWYDDIPTLLFNFDNKVESVTIDRPVYTNNYVSWGRSGGPIEGGHAWIGPIITTMYAGERTGSNSNPTGQQWVSAQTTFDSVDMSAHTKTNSKLVVELKVEDPSNIKWGQWEFSSYTSSYDVYEWAYDFGSDPLNFKGAVTSEYTTFEWPLSYFVENNAPPDMSYIRRIRFWMHTIDGPNSIGFRNARLQAIDADSYIYINHRNSMVLKDYDFTMDFWLKRYRENIDEGVLGQVADHSTLSSFSVTYDVYNYLVVTFYVVGTIYELKSLIPQIDKIWHHIAITRNGAYLSLYIDGKIQNSTDIGIGTEINECVENFYIGKVDTWRFWGYVDEFRLLLGKAEWLSDFDVPTQPYNIGGQAGDPSMARWIKIALPCGDGVTRNINKIGIYPDIRYPYIPTGGYNCDWLPLYDSLSNYKTLAKNLSPTATILGDDLIEVSFENSLIYWDNLIYNSNSDIIAQTDFGGENPQDFWSSSWSNLNSSKSSFYYCGSALSIFMSDEESGSLGFFTDWVEGDQACEIQFNHSTEYKVNRLNTVLRIHCEDGSHYDIRRHQYSTDEQWVVYNNDNWTDYGDFYPSKGFRIERIGDIVKFYIGEPGSWALCEDYTNQASLKGGAVRFEFLIWKESGYPEVNISLESLKVIKLSFESEQVEWGQVESVYGNFALGYKTTNIPINNGPILRHPTVVGGIKAQYIEFYYLNTGAGGGGISFVDNNGNEVFGIATLSPSWAIFSSDGWEVVNDFPNSGNDGWYRVKLMFDWENSIVTIDWEDIDSSVVNTYIKTLIANTNISELHIKSTYGIGWGKDFVDIRFDKITILPTLSFMSTFEPSNCLTGYSTDQGYNNCWGFPSSINEPTLIMDLGELYYVDKFVMHSRPYDDSYDYIVNDFDVYGATSISGTFELLLSETGFTESFNSPGQNVYYLEQPVEVKIIKLIIKSYSKPLTPDVYNIEDRDGNFQSIKLDGGFVREFEVWSSPNSEVINSEDCPIVCMDLLDHFNLTYHSIEGPGKNSNTGELCNWSNENEFYQFSSDNISNPNQVAYSDGYDYTASFAYTEEFMVDDGAEGIYTIETDVFLLSGQYELKWETYSAQEVGGIVLIITGLESKEFPCKYTSTSWAKQENNFSLNQSGYYHIQVKSIMEGVVASWGLRNIYFKNFNYMSRWVALRRNTAENFVWDEGTYDDYIDNYSGIDYLHGIKLFASGNHAPTEYHWMWESVLSVFSNDAVNTKVGKRSLKIEYPESTQIDFISYLEGDHFGHDENWSIKDSLSLWCYIEDIDKISIDSSGFIFGSKYGYYIGDAGGPIDSSLEEYSYNPSADQALYFWRFSDLKLISGWNYVRLRFDKHIETIPDALANSDKLLDALNFKNHVTSSFGMAIGGKGHSFYMLLDGLKIERNRFYDDVVYGDKGLCLTCNDYAEIPLAGIDTRCGSVEAWIKLYTDTTGNDHFNNVSSRTLFTLVDSDNNSISLSIRSSSWFEVGLGNTKDGYITLFVDPKVYDIGEASFNIDDVVHIALVWSNDASKIGGGDSIHLYVNAKLYLSGKVIWESGDNKNTILRLGGGNTYLATNDDSEGSAIFSNVKFYNYCKTSFNIEKQSPPNIDNLTPNDFVQISSDGVVFLNSRDTGLPFEYEQVQPGEKKDIYIRVDKSRIDELDRLTGSINVEWKVPV